MTAAIQKLTEEFTSRMNAVIDNAVNERIKAALQQFVLTPRRSVFAKVADAYFPGAAKQAKTAPARRKGPIQLCPVPRCKNRAAPIFGMVCSKHKDVPKRLIAKYREARRTRKAN